MIWFRIALITDMWPGSPLYDSCKLIDWVSDWQLVSACERLFFFQGNHFADTVSRFPCLFKVRWFVSCSTWTSFTSVASWSNRSAIGDHRQWTVRFNPALLTAGNHYGRLSQNQLGGWAHQCMCAGGGDEIGRHFRGLGQWKIIFDEFGDTINTLALSIIVNHYPSSSSIIHSHHQW